MYSHIQRKALEVTFIPEYMSPEKPPALTTFVLKLDYTVKKADYVCNMPKCEVLSLLGKVRLFGIKEQQFCMTTKQV